MERSIAGVSITVFTLGWIGLAAAMAPRPEPVRGGQGAPEVPWNEAEYVFTAKLESAQAGPVANSFPPIYNHTLSLTVDKSLRGPGKAGEKLSAHHAARQQNMPVFPIGKTVVVAANNSQGTLTVQRIEEYDDEKLKGIETACLLPLGWTTIDGKVVSPWSALGKQAWPADAELKAKLTCSETGRPALLIGPGLKLTVEMVPPKMPVKEHPEWVHPDGDGEYKITLTNTTDKPIEVPALLSSGKDILWNESLVILCQGKAYPIPGAKGVSGKVTATTIPAGKSISTVVNALRLDGPDWPKGGYRIDFQFCLGEQSQTKSFYYLSKHHDVIRDTLLNEKPAQ